MSTPFRVRDYARRFDFASQLRDPVCVRTSGIVPSLLLAACAAPPAPCARWGPAEAVGSLAEAALTEVSGVAASRRSSDVLWVHEDSPAGAILHAIRSSGERLGTLTLSGTTPRDWEDIAAGPCDEGDECLWIADTGDNALDDPEARLLSLAEPEIDVAGPPFSRAADPEVHRFRYPDGPHDVEALAVRRDGRPILLTKRDDGTSHLLGFEDGADADPVRLGTLSLGLAGAANAVTAADLWPDDSRLLVRTTGSLWEFSLDGFDDVGAAPRSEWVPGAELQGEAAAYDAAGGRIVHTGEGESAAIFALSCIE
jgi:hypothetical protein